MPDIPSEAFDAAWQVACSYGELIPAEAERLMSVSGLTSHMALNRAHVETIVRRVAPLLRAGGQPAGRWRTCGPCGDDIWPNERVFPMVAGAVVYDTTLVLCVVCEVKRQIAQARATPREAA